MAILTIDYTSQAYAFDPPTDALRDMKVKAGWAYLKRRSTNVGEFNDEDGTEWETFVDKVSAE
jgi:hypothetical protein